MTIDSKIMELNIRVLIHGESAFCLPAKEYSNSGSHSLVTFGILGDCKGWKSHASEIHRERSKQEIGRKIERRNIDVAHLSAVDFSAIAKVLREFEISPCDLPGQILFDGC